MEYLFFKLKTSMETLDYDVFVNYVALFLSNRDRINVLLCNKLLLNRYKKLFSLLNLKQLKNQSYKDITLENIKQDGDALKYVKNQTPELCLAAVQQDGDALKYVKCL